MYAQGALPGTPLEEIEKQIASCDVLVVFLARSYGSIVPKSQERRSFTWREVELARRRGIPVLAFLWRDEAPWDGPREADPDRVRLLAEFKGFLRSEWVVAEASSLDELQAAVTASLERWQLDSPPPEFARPLDELERVKRMGALLKRFRQAARAGDPIAASRSFDEYKFLCANQDAIDELARELHPELSGREWQEQILRETTLRGDPVETGEAVRRFSRRWTGESRNSAARAEAIQALLDHYWDRESRRSWLDREGGVFALFFGWPILTYWIALATHGAQRVLALGALGAGMGFVLYALYLLYTNPQGPQVGECRSCAQPFRGFRFVPVLPALLRRACSRCQAKLELTGAWIVGVTALTWAGIAFAALPTTAAAYWVSLILISGLVVAAIVDATIWEIPDWVSLGGIGMGLAVAVCVPEYFEGRWVAELLGEWLDLHAGPNRLVAIATSLSGLGLGFGSLTLLNQLSLQQHGREGIGLGAIKLSGALGAFLGAGGWLEVFVWFLGLGLVGGLASLLRWTYVVFRRARERSNPRSFHQLVQRARVLARYQPTGPFWLLAGFLSLVT